MLFQYDELQSKVSTIKLKLFNSYKDTLKEFSDLFQTEEEYNEHDYADNAESQNAVIEVELYEV